VDVCPTGIDIRNGLQLECIGCSNCIDACNDIMKKIGQPTGLIRYDSLNGFNENKKQILRPRLYLYTLLMFIGMCVFAWAISQRHGFEANILRMAQSPYEVEKGLIRNQYIIHLVNKTPRKTILTILPDAQDGLILVLPIKNVELNSLEDRRVPIFAEMPESMYKQEFPLVFHVTDESTGEVIQKSTLFLGPSR
jgi:polyferredoxin